MREALVSLSEAEFDAIGLGELVSHTREAGIRDFEELACHGTGALTQVEVKEPLDTDTLSSLECVDQWELVDDEGDTSLYLIEVTATELPERMADRADDLIGTCDPTFTDRGVLLSLVGPQGIIVEAVEAYETAGASPELERLGDYRGESDLLEALTNRQREVVRTAYELGYYDVPRSASTEDIAAELGVDPSTVSEHLQRAERNLLSQYLSSGI